MTQTNTPCAPSRAVLDKAADRAARMIAPLWPLASSVAVNPFLGQTAETLAEVAARLARVGGVPVTMPRQWYLDRIASREILDEDLAAALAASSHAARPADIDTLKVAAASPAEAPKTLPTVADLAAATSAIDWPGIIEERFGAWAAGYFDEGQALWAAPRDRGAWTIWKAQAIHDLTPEIRGLKGFAAFVADAPSSAAEAIARASSTLGLTEESLPTYFHQLLLSLGGWAQYARHALWTAELAGGSDQTITDFLAIRLLWEEALYTRYKAQLAASWHDVRAKHALPVAPGEAEIVNAILQEAVERACQRGLAATLAAAVPAAGPDRPALQGAFCIDVRSEIFRRALEAVDPSIRTLGFAGFFGMSAKHRRFASDVGELRLPVLLNPTVFSCSGTPEMQARELRLRSSQRAKRAWGRFKLAAVSSFAFVEAMGPVYAGKLVRDALGFAVATSPDDPAPHFDPALDKVTRLKVAETVLRAMSLTSGFARVVLLTGHGANVVNNPYASGLHCGACGGYSGEVNARLLASLLNDQDIRKGLAGRGIEIPDDTLFIAALHDTTTDAITLYDKDIVSTGHKGDLAQIRKWLAAAGAVTRGERALRLPRATKQGDVARRGRDWAEVRPEWALAGCKAFIAAPRHRTSGRTLEGRAFLHDYDWRQDQERNFSVLELIMTAPVVVASWISLQYYGSTVAPGLFGSGNKLLHNVVGGIGVVEGNGGALRSGLPFQSVHDGERLVHEPLRLTVCIEAPVDAMTDVLRRHTGVRDLFDKAWLHLIAIDEHGRLSARYTGNLAWETLEATEKPGQWRAVA
jgi:uncharacterized protein YbcC (UPF0753/DUF2309 family)